MLQIKLGANKSWQVPSVFHAKVSAVLSTCCCCLALCGCLVCFPAFPPQFPFSRKRIPFHCSIVSRAIACSSIGNAHYLWGKSA